MPRTRTLRDEPPPGPVELVFRGILGDTGLDPADLWVADLAFPRELLESTKLVKFECYAEFTVADLTGCGLRLWATGQRPHYDVVEEGNDLESLIAWLAAAPIRTTARGEPPLGRRCRASESQPCSDRARPSLAGSKYGASLVSPVASRTTANSCQGQSRAAGQTVLCQRI